MRVRIDGEGREYDFDDLDIDRRGRPPAPPAAAPVAPSTGAAPASMAGAVPHAVTVQAIRDRIDQINPRHEHHDLLQRLKAGKSLLDPPFPAQYNGRDDAFYRAVSTIVFHLPRHHAKEAVVDALIEIFEPSLDVWASEPGAPKTLDEELDKLEKKFEDVWQQRVERDLEKERQRIADGEAMREAVLPDGKPIEPGPGELPPDLTKLAILQWGAQLYVYSFGWAGNPEKTGYLGPFKKDELLVQLKTLWENAPPTFRRHYVNEKGELKVKQAAMLLDEYGTGILDVQGHLFLQRSYLDPITGTLHQALCPFRVVEPVFDPLIDEWLRLIGGLKADKLLDWVAAVPQIDRQSCALYLEGPMSIGKNVLAHGLSRIWRPAGPTDFGMIMSVGSTPFNASLFRQPFCQLDEGLPAGAKQTSAEIRKMIGRSEHTSNEKGEKHVNVEGAIRLIITANNDAVLLALAAEDYSENDLDAFVNRMLHLKGEQAAADFIVALNARDRSIVDSWIYEDKIAKHALWLAENRVITPGKRFLVEGETTEMHRALVTRGDKRGAVLEFVANYMTSPGKLDHASASDPAPFVLMGDDKLLVNTTGVVKYWDLYVDEGQKKLTRTAIAGVLGSLSHGMVRRGPKVGVRLRYHVINIEHVKSWAQGNVQVGDVDTMVVNLSRPMPAAEEEAA